MSGPPSIALISPHISRPPTRASHLLSGSHNVNSAFAAAPRASPDPLRRNYRSLQFFTISLYQIVSVSKFPVPFQSLAWLRQAEALLSPRSDVTVPLLDKLHSPCHFWMPATHNLSAFLSRHRRPGARPASSANDKNVIYPFVTHPPRRLSPAPFKLSTAYPQWWTRHQS